MKRKEIALIKETREKVFVYSIMDTIAPHLSLKPGQSVGIKINLSGSKEIYANTHYESVEALITYLREKLGITSISVMEGSDGAYFSGKSTWDIFYKFKYKEIEIKGTRLINIDDLPHDQTITVDTISGPHDVSFARSPVDYLISLVPPKTHNIFPVSLSIHNLIGFVKPDERVFMFGASEHEMKRINFFHSEKYFDLVRHANRNFVNLFRQIQPSLALVDGLYGMEGKGPIKGSPVFHGFAIACEDAIQADAMATYVMGFNVDDVPYLNLAYQEELGNSQWQNVIGIDPKIVRFPYRPHPLFHRQRKWNNSHNAQRQGGGQPPRNPRPDGPTHERNHTPQN
jgi:uncharacterized protein (DUF362 family)